MTAGPPPEPGLGVDAAGGPVVDPTKNVLDLVAAAITRQDDLRGAAGSLFQALLGGLQQFIEAKFSGYEKLTDSRFAGIEREFATVERNRLEQKNDTKVAVDAALTSAKELVKEQGTTLNDLRDRLGKVETELRTKAEVHSSGRSDIGMIVGIIGAILGFVSLLVTIVVVMRGAAQ
jgi:hypothetical protein